MKLATTNETPIPVALKEASKDATVQERNFTTPLCSKRPGQIQDGEREQKFVRTDNPPKKGDGKGKGKKAPKGCSDRTPSGQQICFRFKSKCKAKKCKFAHVCGACHLDKRPMYACTHRTRQDAADTQGSGSATACRSWRRSSTVHA